MATLRERFDRVRKRMIAHDDYNLWRVRQIYDQAVKEQKEAIGNSVDAIEKRNELRVRLDVWTKLQLKKAYDWTKPQLKKSS